MTSPTAVPRAVSERDLRLAQAGDRRALDNLFRRELPLLRGWAQSRVPRGLWRRADVDDLVQLTFLRALRRYCDFKAKDGAEFQHYLRRILINLTRDEIRRAGREPDAVELFAGDGASVQPSSLDLLLGQEVRRQFRAALRGLPRRSQTAVLARLQRGLSYEEIATIIGAPGPGAARAVVGRAVERLVHDMRRSRSGRKRSRRKSR